MLKMISANSFSAKLFWCLTVLGTAAQAANPQISQDLFNKFVRYTKFSAASYAANCPTPPYGAVVASFIDIASTDTQVYLFRDDKAKELILAFRGTSGAKDLATDFNQTLVPYNSIGINCPSCMVHGGYVAQWNSASSQVISVINTQMAAYNGYSLTVTGHSMGGSLASLASGSLASSSLGKNITTYTFGQPRTGNPAYANLIDQTLPFGKMFRVTHGNDGVPQTVTVADGYRHHSTEFWENDPASAATTVQCSGQEPPDCNNSKLGVGIGPGGIGINAAHLMYSGMSIGSPADAGKGACSG